MKKDEFSLFFDEYSYSEEAPSFHSVEYQKQLVNVINLHLFQAEPRKTTPSNGLDKPIPPILDQTDPPLFIDLQPVQPPDFINEIVQDPQQISVEVPTKNHSTAQTQTQRQPRGRSRTYQKARKNQYDKNIFGNISKTVLKQMMGGKYEQEIREYCLVVDIEYRAFVEGLAKMDRQCIRLGTSELNHLLHSDQISFGFRKVFSYFFVRYLRDEYLGYVIHEGRMRDKGKYLRCASKMMYIPQLNRSEYCLLAMYTSPQDQ